MGGLGHSEDALEFYTRIRQRLAISFQNPSLRASLFVDLFVPKGTLDASGFKKESTKRPRFLF